MPFVITTTITAMKGRESPPPLLHVMAKLWLAASRLLKKLYSSGRNRYRYWYYFTNRLEFL
jgi:hypothetical protein